MGGGEAAGFVEEHFGAGEDMAVGIFDFDVAGEKAGAV